MVIMIVVSVIEIRMGEFLGSRSGGDGVGSGRGEGRGSGGGGGHGDRRQKGFRRRVIGYGGDAAERMHEEN